MKEKITRTKHIRQQLEDLYQQKYTESKLPKSKPRKYKGLGLNWRDTVILCMFLFFVSLYQAQAHAIKTNSPIIQDCTSILMTIKKA